MTDVRLNRHDYTKAMPMQLMLRDTPGMHFGQTANAAMDQFAVASTLIDGLLRTLSIPFEQLAEPTAANARAMAILFDSDRSTNHAR